MKTGLLISAALLICSNLSGCASNPSNSINTQYKLGKITHKDTIINQSTHRTSPIDIGVGLGGGGHVGWGVNLGLGRLLEFNQTTNEMVFQYKIKISDNESLAIQSNQDFSIGSCLTVLERAGDRNYPKIQGNPTCQLTTP